MRRTVATVGAGLLLAAPLVQLASPAEAADAPAYRGYLQSANDGDRYVLVDDAAGSATVVRSGLGAVDGAVGPASTDAPLYAWVQQDDDTDGTRLHVVGRGGTDTVVFSSTTGDVSEPTFSGDGSALAFVVDDGETSALMTVGVASKAARVVRRSAETAYAGPTFSPDGVYLAWTQQTAKGSDLAVAEVDGARASVLVHRDPAAPELLDAAWSPDGSTFGVMLVEETDEDFTASVATVDARSGALRTVAAASSTSFDQTVYGQPAWSSTGDRLLASRAVLSNSGAQQSLLSFAPDGSDPRELPTQGYSGSPSVAATRQLGDTTPPATPGPLTAGVSGATVRLTVPLAADDRTLADAVVLRDDSSTPTATTVPAGRARDGVVLLSLPAPATTYTFTAYARDWSQNLSSPQSTTVRSPDASSLSVSTPPSTVAYRKAVRLTGRLTQGGGSLAGQRVVLLVRRAGTSTPVAVTSTTTASDGSYVLAYTPAWTAEYSVRYDGGSSAYPSVSAKRVVRVSQLISLKTSAARVTRGAAVVLGGSVAPVRAGALVTVQRYVSGAWRSVGTARVSSTGGYRLTYRPTTAGAQRLRAVVAGTADRLQGVSTPVTLTVR